MNHLITLLLSLCADQKAFLLSDLIEVFGFLHPPVMAPPIKANPMDEAKAAACMDAELRFKPSTITPKQQHCFM